MAQESNILSHLMTRGSITPLEALEEYGCFRLASRICSLKKQGWEIAKDIETKNDKRYAKYFITH